MVEKVLLAYTGSWAGNVKRILEGKKPRDGTPVYISRKRLKKLGEWQELEHYSTWF